MHAVDERIPAADLEQRRASMGYPDAYFPQ
jgi:hypothetical protein